MTNDFTIDLYGRKVPSYVWNYGKSYLFGEQLVFSVKSQ